MFYKRPWFWIMIVGILGVLASIFLLVLTDSNRILWILVLVFSLLMGIIALIYGQVRRKPEKGLVLEEEDLKTRKQFTRNLGQAFKNFDTETSQRVDTYLQTEFPERFKKFSESSGRLAAAPISSAQRLVLI